MKNKPSFLGGPGGASRGYDSESESNRDGSHLPPCLPADLKRAPDYGPPSQYGLPESFTAFRPVQSVAIEDTALSDRRVFVPCMPTGTGKTLYYFGAVKVLDMGRVCVLTATKALTSQIMNDFSGTGIREVRGRNSFKCVTRKDVVVNWKSGDTRPATCEDGNKVKCPFRDPRTAELGMYRCPYKLQVEDAKGADIVVSNYHWWITANMYAWDEEKECNPLGKFDVLVLDEAHDLISILSDFAKIQLGRTDLLPVGEDVMEPGCEDWDVWEGYAGERWKELFTRINDLVLKSDILKHLHEGKPLPQQPDDLPIHIKKAVDEYLDMDQEERDEEYVEVRASIDDLTPTANKFKLVLDVCKSDRSNWIIDWERNTKSSVEFNPIELKHWTERFLFARIPRIIVVSATVRSKTLDMLGVNPSDYHFREYPSPFDPRRVPIFYIPTVRVDYRTEKDPVDMAVWSRRIDEIVGPRLDRKGLIHTVSYGRAYRIVERSKHKDHMIIPQRGKVQQMIEFFKRRTDPCILVGPAMTTGYDFPLTECEFQIIVKVPFPDLSTMSKVMRIRNKRDRGYTSYLTIQELVQECGRGARTQEDLCETFIIDDHASYMLWGKKQDGLVPWWFKRFLQRVEEVPDPHPSLLGWEGGD